MGRQKPNPYVLSFLYFIREHLLPKDKKPLLETSKKLNPYLFRALLESLPASRQA
ncbi:MAG: hypothetical protein U9M92_02455 [Patescibacteria group bacterium]|nr:hypothetical protein [Patescibacteria group bacterium]